MNEMLFLQGQQDCKEGKPHEAGRGQWYDYGFSWQYAEEQRQASKGEKQ